jgi:hypothetical protein
MKLLMENWRGYLAEEELDNELEQIMDQGLAHLIKSVEKIDSKAPEEDLQEIGGIAIAGMALAAPQVLEILGETINWMGSKIKTLMGDSAGPPGLEGTAFGDKLLEVSEKLHHKYISPLTFVSRKLFPDKDPEWHHKWASRLFHVIVAAFLVYSGYAALKAFKAVVAGAGGKTISVGLLELAVAAVKSNELKEFLLQAH